MPGTIVAVVSSHVAGFKENLGLYGCEIVWLQIRAAAERATVIGGHNGSHSIRAGLFGSEAAGRECVPALGRVFKRLARLDLMSHSALNVSGRQNDEAFGVLAGGEIWIAITEH